MAKEYPLVLENWGSDTYYVVSRGHHDFETFEKLVREEYEAWGNFFGCAYHDYVKAVPRQGYQAYYTPCSPDTRGAIPVTVALEGYEEKFGRKSWERHRFSRNQIVVPIQGEKGKTPLEVCQSFDVGMGEDFFASPLGETIRTKRHADDYRIATEAEQQAGHFLGN